MPNGQYITRQYTGVQTLSGAVTFPALSGNPVISADGLTVTLTFNKTVTRGAGYTTGDIDLDGTVTNNVWTYSSGDGTATWVGTVATRILTTETPNLDFNGAANSIEDSGGNDMAVVVNQTVTNSSMIVAFDTFTRANAGTLGANWTDLANSGTTIGIVSNQASYTGTGALTFDVVQWNAATPANANHRQTITLTSTPAGTQQYDLFCRSNGTTSYYARLIGVTSLTIYKSDGTTDTSIATNATTFASGDTYSFGVNGTSLTVYKNGVSALNVTDSTYSSGSQTLIVINISDSSTLTFDNYLLENL